MTLWASTSQTYVGALSLVATHPAVRLRSHAVQWLARFAPHPQACHVLAERMTAKLRAEQSSHGLRTTPSAQFIADTANSIIAASANVVNVPVVEDEGSESKRDAPPMPAIASLNP